MVKTIFLFQTRLCSKDLQLYHLWAKQQVLSCVIGQKKSPTMNFSFWYPVLRRNVCLHFVDFKWTPVKTTLPSEKNSYIKGLHVNFELPCVYHLNKAKNQWQRLSFTESVVVSFFKREKSSCESYEVKRLSVWFSFSSPTTSLETRVSTSTSFQGWIFTCEEK